MLAADLTPLRKLYHQMLYKTKEQIEKEVSKI